MTRPNKSVDASGGSVLCNLLGAAQGALIRTAASTPPLGNLGSLMKRIVISLLAGFALTIGVSTFATLILFRGNSDAIVPGLLYWPVFLVDKLGVGLGCANADSVSDKLTCIRTALLIDAVFYPLVFCVFSFMMHRILTRRSRRLRPSHVVH